MDSREFFFVNENGSSLKKKWLFFLGALDYVVAFYEWTNLLLYTVCKILYSDVFWMQFSSRRVCSYVYEVVDIGITLNIQVYLSKFQKKVISLSIQFLCKDTQIWKNLWLFSGIFSKNAGFKITL